MHFDIFTVLAISCCALVVLGLALIFSWTRHRESPWLAWWGACLALIGPAYLLIMADEVFPEYIQRIFGNGLLILGFGATWQAARSFDGRRVVLWPVALVVAVWVVLYHHPAVRDGQANRVIILSLILGGLILATAYEFWRGRDEALPSRMPMAVIMSLSAMGFLIRLPLLNVAPLPLGALPMTVSMVIAFHGMQFLAGVVTTLLLISLTLERRERRHHEQARRDPLTGLMNRRCLTETFGSAPLPAGVSVAVFDLDGFKAINDTYGHAAGDALIEGFAHICRRNLRQTDFAARLGGEEFAVVMPDCTPRAALDVAERIRCEYTDTSFQAGQRALHGTVSAGVEPVGEDGDITLDQALVRADAELYRAKRSGRNRVCFGGATEAA